MWTDKCKNPFVEVGSLQQTHGDPHMYHEFVIPKHAKKTYGKQQIIWEAPDSLFAK